MAETAYERKAGHLYLYKTARVVTRMYIRDTLNKTDQSELLLSCTSLGDRTFVGQTIAWRFLFVAASKNKARETGSLK